MNLSPIITGLILAAILFYVLWKRRKISEQPAASTKQPPRPAVPTKTKQNNKLVVVKGVTHSDLKKVLTGFCNLYNQETIQAQPRLTKLTEQEFIITFPYDINFEIYCYLINYLVYPMDVDWTPDVRGWTTTTSGDPWITGRTVNKKVMLFIPTDDSEHDNVYLTTSDNIGYKLGFDMVEGTQLPDTLNKTYVEPHFDISRLTDREYEDFS
jgi:hypothetical protein